MIKNEVKLNVEQDPYLVIENLKAQVIALKAEISRLNGNVNVDDPLTEAEKENCRLAIDSFLATEKDSDEPSILNLRDFRKIQFCYQLLKQAIKTSFGNVNINNIENIPKIIMNNA